MTSLQLCENNLRAVGLRYWKPVPLCCGCVRDTLGFRYGQLVGTCDCKARPVDDRRRRWPLFALTALAHDMCHGMQASLAQMFMVGLFRLAAPKQTHHLTNVQTDVETHSFIFRCLRTLSRSLFAHLSLASPPAPRCPAPSSSL